VTSLIPIKQAHQQKGGNVSLGVHCKKSSHKKKQSRWLPTCRADPMLSRRPAASSSSGNLGTNLPTRRNSFTKDSGSGGLPSSKPSISHGKQYSNGKISLHPQHLINSGFLRDVFPYIVGAFSLLSFGLIVYNIAYGFAYHQNTSPSGMGFSWAERVTGNSIYNMAPVQRTVFEEFKPPNQDKLLALKKSVGRKIRVCFATFSLVGPTKNGGIATADTALAEAFVESGDYEVTVLYLWGNMVQSKTIQHWVDFYGQKGIKVIPMHVDMKLSPVTGSKYVKSAYHAYLWLKERDGHFDMIHFHEWHGQGYYVSLAKHQGLAFQNTYLFTTIHCPSLFYLHGSSVLMSTFNYMVSDFLEKKQVEYSDMVVSPSAFMLKWVQSDGWTLPKNTYVQQNILSNAVFQRMPEESSISHDKKTVTEFVFFGRLEVLKGFYQFLDALDILSTLVSKNELRPFEVTFMGSANLGKGNNPNEILQKRANSSNWKFTPKVLTNMLQPEAVAYLQSGNGRVAVMPSLVENSPYAVLECLALGIPFMASTVGGIPELIHPEYHDSVLFWPDAKTIAAKMKKALIDGIALPKGTSTPHETKKLWVDYHTEVILKYIKQQERANQPHSIEIPTSGPLVTVCTPYHNRGSIFYQTVDTLYSQDYKDYEWIIIDDGSDDQAALDVLHDVEKKFHDGAAQTSMKRIQVIRQENMYPGAARNRCVRAARGSYVLFLDDDDIPRKNWISTMVAVAQRTNADVVTTMCDFFHGGAFPSERFQPNPRWVTLGDAVDVGMYDNVFGAYAALIKRKVFDRIGGYSEDYGSTFEDYELFANAVLKGLKLELVPEGLLWYRQNPGSHLMKSTNRYDNRIRAIRPYLAAVPPNLRNALLMGFGHVKQSPVVTTQTRQRPISAGNRGNFSTPVDHHDEEVRHDDTSDQGLDDLPHEEEIRQT
jgi:glycosyltransferase involved in cell wall biosynthesis